MKQIITLIFSLILLNGNSVFAHKDRVEAPTIFLFYFGKERIEIKSSESTKLNHYIGLITSHKKQVTSVECFFDTKEVVTLTFDNFKCSRIEILVKNKRTITVPNTIVRKISSINVKTVRLVWSDSSTTPFESGNFNFEFSSKDTELPLLNLAFENYHFSEAIIWNKSDENSRQWRKF